MTLRRWVRSIDLGAFRFGAEVGSPDELAAMTDEELIERARAVSTRILTEWRAGAELEPRGAALLLEMATHFALDLVDTEPAELRALAAGAAR
jgi:hypothetical protein